jgi:hypothetical protein
MNGTRRPTAIATDASRELYRLIAIEPACANIDLLMVGRDECALLQTPKAPSAFTAPPPPNTLRWKWPVPDNSWNLEVQKFVATITERRRPISLIKRVYRENDA